MRTIGQINVVGTVVNVALATKDEEGPDFDETSYGAYDPETSTIYLRDFGAKAPRPASARFSDLIHEAVHAVLWENGGTKLIEQYLPDSSPEARQMFEEQLVRCITPGLVTTWDGLMDLHLDLHEVKP